MTAEPLVSGPDDIQLRRRLRHLCRFLQVDVRVIVRPAQVAASSPTMAAGGSTAAAAASQRAGLRGAFSIRNNQHNNLKKKNNVHQASDLENLLVRPIKHLSKKLSYSGENTTARCTPSFATQFFFAYF